MDFVGEAKGSFNSTASSAIEPQTGQLRMGSATPEVRQPTTIPEKASTEPFSVEMLKGRVRVVGELSNKEDAQTLLNFLTSAIAFLPTKSAENRSPDDRDRAADWDDDDV